MKSYLNSFLVSWADNVNDNKMRLAQLPWLPSTKTHQRLSMWHGGLRGWQFPLRKRGLALDLAQGEIFSIVARME